MKEQCSFELLMAQLNPVKMEATGYFIVYLIFLYIKDWTKVWSCGVVDVQLTLYKNGGI